MNDENDIPASTPSDNAGDGVSPAVPEPSSASRSQAVYEAIAAAGRENASPAAVNPAPSTSYPRKRRGCLWAFLLCIALLLLIVVVAGATARCRYNDNFIRETTAQSVSDALGIQCKIGKAQCSLWDGKVRFSDITLDLGGDRQAHGAQARFFTIKDLVADIQVWNSLRSLSLQCRVDVNDWELAIRRERRARPAGYKPQSRLRKKIVAADEEDSTTNIHETLQQMATLPWHEWVSHLDVLILAQAVEVRLHDGRITLHDDTGRLGACTLPANDIAIKKNGALADAELHLRLTTPQTPNTGSLDFTVSGVLVPQAEGLRKIGEFRLNCDYNNLDIPYICRYFGINYRLNKRARIHLGAPLSGKISAQAPTLADEVAIKYSTETPHLLAVTPADPKLVFPGLKLTGALKMQLPKTWTLEENRFTVGLANANWLDLTVSGTGRLGDELTLNAGLDQFLGEFSHSALAERWGLANNFAGKLNLKAFAKISAKERSSVSVDLIANSLGVMVDGEMQDFPITGRASTKFSLTDKGEAENIETDIKLESPILNCATGEKLLKIRSSAAPEDFDGTFTVDLNTVELYKRFRRTMTELGLGDLQEQITGTINCDGKALSCALTLAHLNGQPDPLQLTGNFSPLKGGKHDFNAEIHSVDNYLRMQMSGKAVTDAPGGIKVDFSQQVAMYLQKGAAFYRRFASLFGNSTLPAMKGVLRGRLDGKFSQNGDNTAVTLRANTLLENAVLKDGDFVWQEPKAQIAGEIAYSANGNEQNLTVPSLQVRSSAANMNFTSGAWPLHLLGGTLPELLAHLPAINLGLVIGENAWRQVNYLTGNAIPAAYFSLDSQATVMANYNPAEQTFNLTNVTVKGGAKPAALKELQMQLTVRDLAKLAATPTLQQAFASLSQGVHINRAVVSVPALKQIPGALENASIRALQGQHIIVNDLKLIPEGNDCRLTGMAGIALAFTNNTGKLPLLQFGGWAGFPAASPLIIHLEGKDAVSVKGALDLTNCAIRFNALDPYIYQKANKEPLRLAFAATQHANGNVEVASATLNGGMLPVALKQFALSVPDSESIKIKLASARLGAPFNLHLHDVDIDKRQNYIHGGVEVGTVDLGMLAGFMPSLKDAKLSGKLDKASVSLNLPYQSLLGKTVNLSNLGTSAVKAGSFDLTVTNPAKRAAMRCAFTGAELDGATGHLNISGLRVENPAGFSTDRPAVSINTISVNPQLSTLGTPTFMIDEILLDGLHILYQSIKEKGNNFAALQAAVEGVTGTSAEPDNSAGTSANAKGSAGQSSAPAVSASATNPPVIIRTLRTVNSKVKIDAPGEIGDGMEPDVNITLNNPGEAGTGNLFWQVVRSMTWPITKEVLKQLYKADPKLILNVSGKMLDSVGLGNVKGMIGKAGGASIDASKDAIGGVLNLGKKMLGGGSDNNRKDASKNNDQKTIEETGKRLLNVFGGGSKNKKK